MKIKKFFRLTLTIKIFILILTGFILVEVIHAQATITNSRYLAESELQLGGESVGINELAWDFSENYNSINDNSFLKKVKELENRQVVLLDNNMNVVDKNLYMSNSNLLTTMVLENKNENGEYYKIVFKNEDKEFLSRLEIDLQTGLDSHGNIFDIYIAFKNTKKEYSIDDISYLSIDSKTFIDNKDNKEKIHVGVSQYVSPTLRLYPGYNKWYINEEVTISKCVDRFSDYGFSYDFITENEEGKNPKVKVEVASSFDEDGTLYFAKLVPLISKDDLRADNTIDKSKIKGYLAYYDLNTDVLSQIYKNVVNENKVVYIIDLSISIIISLIISLMLTKRVKKISAATERIANNEFDIKLKERPYDELGTLSRNINFMSERLKITINKLNDEIENVKKLESIRKEFIANFTHEIKTPLGIIDGYIELIEDCKNEEKKLKYFEEISKETERINGLVLAMLNLSRLESGKVELHIQD
ncbi:MAG: HAMP domain-containing sensor histidine kinase, partial [Coprobacillus sp.]